MEQEHDQDQNETIETDVAKAQSFGSDSARSPLKSLNTRLLIAFVAIGIVPLAAVGFFAVNRAQAGLTQKAGIQVESLAVETGELLDRTLEQRYRDMQAFSQVALPADPVEARETFNIRVRSYDAYDLLLATDATGRITVANTIDASGEPINTSGLIGQDVSDTDWFQRARADHGTGVVHYSDADRNDLLDAVFESGRIGLPFTAGLDGDGPFTGAIHAVVSYERTIVDVMHELEHELAATGAQTTTTSVIRSDGMMLYHTGDNHPLSRNLLEDNVSAAEASLADGSLGYTIEPGLTDDGDAIYGYGNANGAHDFPGYGWGITVEQTLAEATTTATVLRNGVIVFGLVTAVIVGVLGWLAAGSVSRPIKVISERAHAVTAGALHVDNMEMDRDDEIGELADSFDTMTDMLSLLGAKVKAIADGEISNQLLDEELPGELGETVETMTTSLRSLVSSLKSSSDMLATASGELQNVSFSMGASAEDTSMMATQASAAGDEVSANVGSVAAAIEELNASIEDVSGNAAQASDVASDAVEVAHETSRTIEKLGRSSEEIGEVIGVISSIAEQTNLLALNATIEAARAGETGKGFSVVANEVKELANQTAAATEEISARIEAIQTETREAIEANHRITETIDSINDISGRIARTVGEQSATTQEIGRNVEVAATGTNEIARSIAAVADAADGTRNSTDETRANADSMAALATELQGLVGNYT